MNMQLSQAIRWTRGAACTTVQRSARLAHRLILSVGLTVILVALVSWLSPSWRSGLTAQLRLMLSETVPPDFGRLLADDSGAHRVSTADVRASPTSARSVAFRKQAQADSMQPAFARLTGWLLPQPQFEPRLEPEPELVSERRTRRTQARIAHYLARRYHIARVPLGNLVKAAFATGQAFDLDPLLLLAVMAVESRFNPYAESAVGAQGLMQVMPKIHSHKFNDFGGPEAMLDPLTNLKVGAWILHECITRAGSLTGGLSRYVGAVPANNSVYAKKVLAERKRLRDVARGLNVSIYAALQPQLRAFPIVPDGLEFSSVVMQMADEAALERTRFNLNASSWS